VTARLVLDTHVWLDWLVFQDPGVAPLRAAVEAGRAEVFLDERCGEELARVLAYPIGRKALDAAAQAACLERCARIARKPEDDTRRAQPPLPACRDPDDQKFLELARACAADFLVTKDRALLELARGRRRTLAFRIVTPVALAREL
jgi:putative PIN family toxin of toxin-antitoxin system